jgi:hypothetical protein
MKVALILVCAFKYFSPQTTNCETGRWESAIQNSEVRDWQKKQLNHRSRGNSFRLASVMQIVVLA